MEKLLLHINEPEQIKIMSAHLQDVIIKTSDIKFLEKKRCFAMVGNRFCWEANEGENYRILCGFHFDCVEKVSYRGFKQSDDGLALNLLAICFEAGELPSGVVQLIFADNCEVQLEVESVQAFLQDVSEKWQVKTRPQHGISSDETEKNK